MLKIRKSLLPLGSFLLILNFGCTPNKKGKETSPFEKFKSQIAAEANDKSICFLGGSMKHVNLPNLDAFESVSSSVRLQLDAKNKDECIHAAQSYCMARTAQGYYPDNLSVSFGSKAPGGTLIHYDVDKSCNTTLRPE